MPFFKWSLGAVERLTENNLNGEVHVSVNWPALSPLSYCVLHGKSVSETSIISEKLSFSSRSTVVGVARFRRVFYIRR